MTDTFLPSPVQVTPPPSPGQILSGMKPEPEPEPTISARDRLFVGPKVVQTTSKLGQSAATASSVAEAWNPDPTNINMVARVEQFRKGSPDMDPDAVFRKLAPNPGLLQGRAGKLFNQIQAGKALPEQDWDELKATLQQVGTSLKDVSDDLKVGTGTVRAVYTPPEGIWATVGYPRPSRSDGLPASLTGRPSRTLPQMALDWPVTDDLTVFAGPADVVYAARPTPETDFQLRNLRPGPIGADGVPRWVPVEPLPVESHRAVDRLAVSNPAAVVDSYTGRDVYPGLKGGDWIVWDVPASNTPRAWRPPSWMKGAARLKAGVSSSGPQFALTAVPKAQLIDQRTLNDRLDDTAWAVFEAQGDPQSTSHLVSKLKKQGLEPIELDSERKSWLVFGVDPATAAELSPKRPVYVNSGVLAPDDADVEPQTFRFGKFTFQSRPGAASVAVPRTAKRVDRWAFRAEPEQAAKLASFSKELEVLGAGNVSIYSREAQIEGFEPAREYLYTDGLSLRAVRTASQKLGDPNAIPVHVRSTKGWVTEAPNVQVDVRDVPIEQVNGKYVVRAEGPDLHDAVQTAAKLGAAYGQDKVRLVGPNGTVKLWSLD